MLFQTRGSFMRFDNTLVIAAGDVAINNTSSPITLESLYGFSVQAVFTGSPVGELKLQGSCDPGKPTANSYGTDVVNWNDISSPVAISASGNTIFNLDAQFYKWLRVVYTATSGTGTINVRFNGKGV